MARFDHFVGLDVGKYTVAVYADGIEASFEISNDASGHSKLIAILEQAGLKRSGTLMVLEPTGGYETPLWACLFESQYLVKRVDAKQVRHFAKAGGLLAKTDPIDARLLRNYACAFPDRGQELSAENQRCIKDFVARRSALVETRKGVRCRLKQSAQAKLINMDQELETMLNQQIEGIERKICELVDDDKQMANKNEMLQSIPGIGPVMGWMLLAHMPELGRARDKQIAALAGVAPFAHDSGRSNGKRFVQMGRRALRNVLYQAALVASRYNPDLKNFAERLKKAGKPHKLIITAVARKLIVLANTIVRQNRMWEPKS